MLVMKFGGTSVGDAGCFARVARIIVQHCEKEPVVVVSAMSGVTNTLLALAHQAQTGDASVTSGPVTEMMASHQAVIHEAITSEREKATVSRDLAAYGRDLVSILTGICLVRECSPRSLDAVASFGEKMSATLLAGVLRDRGYKAQAISAENLIITDDNHGQAIPLLPVSNRRIKRHIPRLVEQGIIPVITGFIARSTSGATTTLSRGGSDFSASLIGAALDAEQIWIWTDVDGVLTADPRLVPQAHPLEALSYTEAAELSYFGAKVLHPKTIAPALGKGIPVWIKNSFNPDFPGTLIAASRPPANGANTVKSITSMANMNLVTVQGSGMIGVPGIAARVFSAVASIGANVMMISQSSSEYNICFIVSKTHSNKVVTALRSEFARELRAGDISDIWTQDVAVLAAVGEGMRGTPGVAGRLFGALGRDGINVIAIAQGSSELNISLVVEESQRVPALRCIHKEFIG